MDANQEIIHSNSEQEIYENATRVLAKNSSYMGSWIALAIDDEQKTLKPCAHFGFSKGYIDTLKRSWGENPHGQGPSGIAVRTMKPYIANNILNDPRFEQWKQHALEHGYQSSVALPLIIDGRAIGLLKIYAKESDAFDENEIELLTEMAEDIAYGVNAQHLKVSNEEYLLKLYSSMGQAVEAIALTVEIRDPYTAGHMSRVAELAVAIGEELKFDEDQLEGLRIGGIIHDLGKIYIPAEILNRPGKLSSAEFDMIKTHPRIGYEILKGIDFPWPIAEMVLQHHERMDGSGYPDGLKGDKIILEAKILAVADVIEAVSSHRPYRPALSIETGLDIINKAKGSSYDPEIVEICLKLIQHDGFKFSSSF